MAKEGIAEVPKFSERLAIKDEGEEIATGGLTCHLHD